MYNLSHFLAIMLLPAVRPLHAQTVHVNASTGNDAANDKVETPVATNRKNPIGHNF